MMVLLSINSMGMRALIGFLLALIPALAIKTKDKHTKKNIFFIIHSVINIP